MSIDKIRKGYAFDDVLLEPSFSSVLPHETDLSTFLTRDIQLKVPLVSAAMDTVTESRLAIALAQNGGVGVIHRNMTIEDQVREVKLVKRYESGIVFNPITVFQDDTISLAVAAMKRHNVSGFPVLDRTTKKLVGILTNRDMRFVQNFNVPVSELMTCENLVKVSVKQEGISLLEAKEILGKSRVEKLLLEDENGYCVGLMTVKDIERSDHYPDASKDSLGSLRVGAAVGCQPSDLERAEGLLSAGVDFIVLDTAHGHSLSVLKQVRKLREAFPLLPIIAGNVAVKDAVDALVAEKVVAVKVGIGPGSICTTRIISGVGVPQLTAIMDCVAAAEKHQIPIIADGGIKFSGDFAKAIAAGASSVMLGSVFAGTHEAPGETFLKNGRSYKFYRGMGSEGAMRSGSADRYAQSHLNPEKFVPEGVEGCVPDRGPIVHMIHQMLGGLRAAMGYTGCRTIEEMRKNCKFINMTHAGLRESHVHTISVLREPSNYSSEF